MKILILTQYFPPEVGAPQNRLYELAVRLKNQGEDITVLTAMPNYPQMKIYDAYRGKFRHYENMDGLNVYRSWIFVKKSKAIVWRLFNYFSFVFSSFWSAVFRLGKFDLIICESPPLFLGITAFFLKKIKRSKLLFNVSDLWPESAEKIGVIKNKFFLKISYRLEKFLYKKSELISGQTQGIVNKISEQFPNKSVYWLPNGVDIGYYDSAKQFADWRRENGFAPDDFILLYAGIIGLVYKFELIFDAAKALQYNTKIKFAIVGNGPEKERLLALKQKMNLTNIFFFDAVSKDKMPSLIQSTDLTIIPLRNTDLAKGTIPTKLFEIFAMEKTALLGLEGESINLFVDEGKCALPFKPESAVDLIEKIQMLYNDRELLKSLGKNGRQYVSEKFNRDKIAADFLRHIKSQLKQ